MNRILVTGGFGFLGSHLVEKLIQDQSNHVHVVDEFLGEIGCPRNLTYQLTSIAEYYDELRDDGFQQIYHLASVVGPAGVLPHAGKIIKYIVEDSYRVIDLAIRWGAKLIYLSTSEVYGVVQNDCCREDHPKIFPAETTIRMEYGIGKLAAEIAVVNTCRVSQLQTCVVRPFNIAGPRQSGKGGFVLPRFISQALKEEPLTVFGDGTQVRAFTHVKDVVDGLILAMQYGRNGEIYNLGNPANRTTISELADRVITLTHSRSKVEFVDPRTIFGSLYAEVGDKKPDATRAMRELQWRPKHNLDVVIMDTVEFIRQRD